jgi:hypothetical protein
MAAFLLMEQLVFANNELSSNNPIMKGSLPPVDAIKNAQLVYYLVGSIE